METKRKGLQEDEWGQREILQHAKVQSPVVLCVTVASVCHQRGCGVEKGVGGNLSGSSYAAAGAGVVCVSGGRERKERRGSSADRLGPR